jgi:acyl carrier protein
MEKISMSNQFNENDPRLQNLDNEFINIIETLAKRFSQMTLLRQGRTFHKAATTLAGKMYIINNPKIPAHHFFDPNKQYAVIIRHANGVQEDDAAIDNRGATLRVLNPADAENFSSPLFDLLLTTGECFFSRNAQDFYTWMTCNAQEREQIATANPQLAKASWDMMRYAESYTQLYYYSKVANHFVDTAGKQYLARFRLIPVSRIKESGYVIERATVLPPELTKRAEQDKRDIDFLHQDLRKLIARDGINYLLQVQVRPKIANSTVLLDCTHPWSATETEWLDVAHLHLNTIVDNSKIESLDFNPVNAPADLSMPLASSPTDPASLNHLRSIVYALSALVRLGNPLPDIRKIISNQKKPIENIVYSAANNKSTAKVCVIGAGPSGLMAAKELTALGYEVVVIERHNKAGGKARTLNIDGLSYNLGGHVCTSQYLELAKLIKEYGISQTIDAHPYHYDIDANKIIDLNINLATYKQEYAIYQKALQQEFSDVHKAGFYHAARSLAEPVEDWAASLGILELKKRIATVFTSSGYGYVDRKEIPALYFVKLMEMLNLATPLSLNWTIDAGFQTLWDKMADGINDIRYDTMVESIKRQANGVTIYTNKGIIECQKLIITSYPDQALAFLDATADEQSLFTKIKYNDYYTTLCRIKNIPRKGFYFIHQHCEDSSYQGHSVAFLHAHADSDIYSFYSYATPCMNGDDIIRGIKKDVAKMGGNFIETVHQEHWKYFPHVDSQAIRERFFQKIEDLQGKNNTFYIGSLLNFELVECNIAYAKALISKFFALQENTQINEIPTEIMLSQDSLQHAVKDDTAAIATYLKQLIATAQGVDVELIDAEAEFFGMGLDSMRVADMLHEVSAELKLALEPTVFFEYPTVNKLADYLAKQIKGEFKLAINSEITLNAQHNFTNDNTVTIAAYLKQLIATAQGVDVDLIDAEAEFFGMGLDSMRVADMLHEVSAELKLALEPTVFFEYPTVNKLAQYLAQMIAKSAIPLKLPIINQKQLANELQHGLQ